MSNKRQIYTTDTSVKKRQRRNKILGISLALCFLAAFGCFIFYFILKQGPVPATASGSIPAVSAFTGTEQQQPASLPEPEPPPPSERRVHFSAVGDNLIHDGIYKQANQRAGGQGYDFTYLYENVTYFFEPFDVNWINQETLVNNQLPPSTYPQFSTPGELGQAAYEAGWRVFALSNNHSYDMGAKGIAATLDFWGSMPDDVVTPGFFTAGDEDANIKIHQVNGMSIAYLSYTEYTNGLPTPAEAPATIIYTSETERIQGQIQRAKELADAVVVGLHWGVEDSHTITDAQRALAADVANWGADVIIGTHPHVIQPVEWLTTTDDGRNVLVIYSLGNFVSAQSKKDQLIGLALTFDLVQNLQPDGTAGAVYLENPKAHPTVTHYDAGYKNIRVYMYRDYTEELAGQHGVHAKYPGFDLEYIRSVLQEYVSPDILVLE